MAVLWPINGGDPNHLLHGMILQVVKCPRFRRRHPASSVSVPRLSRRPPHHLAANPATWMRQSSEHLEKRQRMEDYLGGIFAVIFFGLEDRHRCYGGKKLAHKFPKHLICLFQDIFWGGRFLYDFFPKPMFSG